MLAILFASALVLITEMLNTSIETIVDMITDTYRPAAKFAKDVAAGAVLIAALNALAVGTVVFVNSGRLMEVRTRLEAPATPMVLTAGFVLMLTLVLLLKILGRKGALLQGGVVSGHAAIAFFLATTIIFMTNSLLVSFFAILLAALVAQSRLEARFHTLQEVLWGAALAILITALLYRIPPLMVHFLPKAAGGQ
jgi:diacylglycerol kinase (ATP)